MMNPLAVAVLAFKLETNQSKIQLFPGHDFKAKDGRPNEVQRWKISRQIAQQLIRQINQQRDKVLIDYEHQTLQSAKNGQPSPAAGWFKNLEWIEGSGLFATGVEWTERAKQFIKNREYRYISPVFSYNKITGEILSIHHAALVNFPAIDGMQDVFELTAAKAQYTAVNQLSREELSVCRLTGVSKQDFVATKMKNQQDHFTSALRNNQGLTETELSVCQKTGIDVSDYAATKSC